MKKTLWGAGGKLSMKEILKDLRDESDKYKNSNSLTIITKKLRMQMKTLP